MRRSIEYIFKGNIQRLFDSFSNLLGIRISFSSFEKSGLTDFTEYQIGHNRPKCEFCNIIQKELGLLPRCIESDKARIEESTLTGDLVCYQCHAGMTEAIMPISSSDRVIGFIMVGEIRHAKIPPDHILNSFTTKKQRQRLIDEYSKTRLYTSKEITSIMDIFSSMVKYIIQARLIVTKPQDSIAPLIQYMEENPAVNLSLQDAAELLFCSVSSLTQNFKKVTGKTFKQYQIELKLEKVDEMLENSQNMSISEAAKKLGFNDPLYFSRMYKKNRGYPPSQRYTP